MGLLQANRVQRKARYFIHYSHRDIEIDYESDTEEFGSKNRCESFFLNLRQFKKIVTSKNHMRYFTNNGVVLKRKIGRSLEVGIPS